MKKNILFFCLFALLICFGFSNLSFAKEEITILISGQSHSSLYPCSCPKQPLGGVARRATLIKQIKEKDKNAFLLEGGGSFAGGNYDSDFQTTEFDKERTGFYMQSLTKMGYDAFLVSSDEFNFGDAFLKEIMSKNKLNYLSANLKDNLQPYIVKKAGNVKVAVVGITDAIVKDKTQKQFISPEEALIKVIKEIKDGKKADLVVVLSYSGEKESKDLLGKIEGVDIWVSSNNPFMAGNAEKINQTIFVRSSWEARSLTKINLMLSDSGVKNFKDIELTVGKLQEAAAGSENQDKVNVEFVELSENFVDDAEIASIVPQCFTDKDCKKAGFTAKCENAGTKKAKCIFSELKPLKISIIKPKQCKTCNLGETVEKIKNIIPNLEINEIPEDSKEAKDLIEKNNIKMLPVYLFDQAIEKEEAMSQIRQIAKKMDTYYILDPQFTGVSYFTRRERIPFRLDVFFDITTKDIVKILEVLQTLKSKRKDIDMHLNFLAIEDSKVGFIAKGERYEIEEFLRGACISKYYPDKLWDYLTCRLSDVGSSWWDDCVVKFSIDPNKIKACAQTDEGRVLLRGFIKLTQELEVVFGPTFVINNQEVFSSAGVPTVEELEKLFE